MLQFCMVFSALLFVTFLHSADLRFCDLAALFGHKNEIICRGYQLGFYTSIKHLY